MGKRYTCSCALRGKPHLVFFTDKVNHEKALAEKVAQEKELDRTLDKAAVRDNLFQRTLAFNNMSYRMILGLYPWRTLPIFLWKTR